MGLKELMGKIGLGKLPNVTKYKENKSASSFLDDYEASEVKRKAKAAKKAKKLAVK